MKYEDLKEKSKSLRIAAMKSKAANDRFASEELIGALSEADGIAKKELREVTEADVTTAINRCVKRVNDMINTLTEAGKDVPEEHQVRKATLMALLPKQMDEQELEAAISNIIFGSLGGIGSADKGKIMKALKEKYNGQYDGKLANTVVTRILSA